MIRTAWGGVVGGMYSNPAPTSSDLRLVDGGIMAFAYHPLSTQVPEITSPLHMNRMAISPDGRTGLEINTPVGQGAVRYYLAPPSIPVLLDPSQLGHLETAVSLVARVVPPPVNIRQEIQASNEAFVQLYYHGFFRQDVFPDQGFLLDARPDGGGSVGPLSGTDPAEFLASVAVELAIQTSLTEVELEAAVEEALTHVPAHPVMDGTGHRYQPAYLEPPGYKVVQYSRTPLLAHLAPTKGVLNFSMPIDTTGDLASVSGWFRPAVAQIVDELRQQDASVSVETVFGTRTDLAPS